MLTEVIEVLRGQNMMMTSSVTMLARGFVTIEGSLPRWRPDISVIEIVSKHVIAQQADPKFLATQLIDLATTERRFGRGLGKLPTQLSNTLEMLDRGQIKVNSDIEVSSRILATAYACGAHFPGDAVGGAVSGLVYPVHHGHAAAAARRAPCSACSATWARSCGAYTVFHILVSRHRLLNNEEPR